MSTGIGLPSLHGGDDLLVGHLGAECISKFAASDSGRECHGLSPMKVTRVRPGIVVDVNAQVGPARGVLS